MERPVVYANAYTVNLSNLEVLIDFKMLTPENRDPNRLETITVRVVQTIKSATLLRDLLTRILAQSKDTGGDISSARF